MDGNTLMAIALKALKNSKSGGGGSIETDKSLTKENAAADAKATGDAISSLNEDIGDYVINVSVLNIYDKSAQGNIIDYALESNGEPTELDGCCVTSFIKLDADTDYQMVNYQNGISAIGFYDESKVFINKSGEWHDPSAVIEIPSENFVRYIRVELFNTTSFDGDSVKLIICKKGLLDGNYHEYNEVKKEYKFGTGDIDNTANFITQEETKQLITKPYEMTNYMLFADVYASKKYVNGVMQDTNWWSATSKLKLDKRYNMYSPAVDGNAVFFDKKGKYLSETEFKNGVPVYAGSYPLNAEYVAFSYQNDYMVSYQNTMYVIRTDNSNARTKVFYPTTKKEVGKRPQIYIYKNDSQETIIWKLADAFLTRDCDVFFEPSTYVFDDAFVYLYKEYNYRQYIELPIGGNCRYYFNGSTLIANANDVIESIGNIGIINLLSCQDSSNGESYELHDGILVNNGGTYVVHDECGGKPTKYVHKYYNMLFEYNTVKQTDNIRKCIGGGTGLLGESIFENCVFKTDHTYDLSFHGIEGSRTDESDFVLKCSNCYFSNSISLDQLAPNQTAELYISNCSAKAIPQNNIGTKGVWGVKSWCNETRESN